jgi:hypothetical protein
MRWLSGGFITVYALAAAVILTVVIIVFSLVPPFEPLKVKDGSFRLDTTTACPGEYVGTKADGDIEPNSQITLSLDPYWYNVETHEFLDEGVASYSLPNGANSLPPDANLVFEAPNEPGDWEFTIRTTVEGRKGVLPRKDELKLTASEPLTVEDCGEIYSKEQHNKE